MTMVWIVYSGILLIILIRLTFHTDIKITNFFMKLVHNSFVNEVILNRKTIDNYSVIIKKIDEMVLQYKLKKHNMMIYFINIDIIYY
jgi:hypothetical protein